MQDYRIAQGGLPVPPDKPELAQKIAEQTADHPPMFEGLNRARVPLREKSRLLRGDEVIRHKSIPWLVQDVIHEVGLGQLAAREDTGKSLAAVDLALSIANDLPEWMGHRINRHGPVVYCAMEGGPVVQSYIDAWLVDNPGTSLDNFLLLDEEELDVTNPASLTDLQQDIWLSLGSEKPVLMVFDTQIDVFGEADENGPEMGRLLGSARRWLVAQGIFGLFVHHAGYEGTRGRGSTSIRGKCDVMAFMNKDKSVFEWQKIKGNKKPAPVPFCVEGVPGSTGAVVRFNVTGRLSDTPAGQAGHESAEKNARTTTAVLELLKKPSDRMQRGKAGGWSNNELCKALKALKSRLPEQGGPIDVHVSPQYVQPILDRLALEELITDIADTKKNGSGFQWRLTADL